MKITAIQKAIQQLGFLPKSHPCSGVWDNPTDQGYRQAALSDNFPEHLCVQPQYDSQLPPSIAKLIGAAKPADDTNEEADALILAEAAKKQAAIDAELLAKAKAQAEAAAAAEAEALAKAQAEAEAAAKAAAAPADNVPADQSGSGFNVQSGGKQTGGKNSR